MFEINLKVVTLAASLAALAIENLKFTYVCQIMEYLRQEKRKTVRKYKKDLYKIVYIRCEWL
jgi:hypothetical protein